MLLLLSVDAKPWLRFRNEGTVAAKFRKDGAVYIPGFLDEPVFEELRLECRRQRSKLKLEQNSIANGRLGRVLDRCVLPQPQYPISRAQPSAVAAAARRRMRR